MLHQFRTDPYPCSFFSFIFRAILLGIQTTYLHHHGKRGVKKKKKKKQIEFTSTFIGKIKVEKLASKELLVFIQQCIPPWLRYFSIEPKQPVRNNFQKLQA